MCEYSFSCSRGRILSTSARFEQLQSNYSLLDTMRVKVTGNVFKNVRYVPDSTCAVMREGQHGQRVMDSVGSATSYSCGG